MLSEEQRGFTRLLTLAQMLCQRAWKLSDLATEFEVPRSTIWRNIQTLIDAGFPIVNERGGWRMNTQARLPITFTAEELLSLFVAASTPALNSGVPLSEPLTTALRKIETLVAPQHARAARRLGNRVQVSVPSHSDYKAVKGIFSRLERAIYENRCVAARYQPLGADQPRDHTLCPLALFFRRHSWYAVAAIADSPHPLTFKLIRFQSVTLRDEKFTPPPDFSLDAHLARAWELFTDDPVDVTAKFAPRLVPLLKEQQRHPTQRIEDLPDGSALLHVQVPLAPDFIGWLLGFGAEVEVLHLSELREQLRDTAEAMVKLYSRPPVRRRT